MILDNIIRSISEGDMEQILLYFPVLIIATGVLILLIIYIKDRWHGFQSWLSKLKIKTKRSKAKKVVEVKEEKRRIDYEKEVEGILKEKDSSKAMDRMLMLINQYFAQLFNMNDMFTYEELINEIEKRKKVDLKTFCENLIRIEFSKNEVSRKELENVANEFLSLTKKPTLRLELPSPKKFIKKLKIFENLKRFKKELQRDLEREKTFQEKVEKVIEKIAKSSWGLIKGYFSSTKVPKKVSFETVLEDVKQHKARKSFKILDEDKPTFEGLLYFAYLTIKKRIRENKKVSEINTTIKKGGQMLSEKKDVLQAETLYYSLMPVYNSLSDKYKKKILSKIVSFYEDINNAVKLQEATMYLLQMKLALKSKEKKKAEQFYLAVSKIYEQLPPQYKNEIYEQFLDLEKELNANVAE